MMTLSIIWLTLPCTGRPHGKLTAGIDAAQAVRGIAGIQFGYGFAEHWSVHAGISIDFRQIRQAAGDEEHIHDAEFGNAGCSSSGLNYCTNSIFIRHWPSETFRNAFIGIGAEFGDTKGADMQLSAGYAIRIWKGFMLAVSYGIGLRECINKNYPDASGISLCISYNF